MASIHVATTGSDLADGTADHPLRTINAAARRALPGDTVTVHAGEYREWVDPVRGGLGETRRITYEAAPGERVVIKGSERVTGWVIVSGTVWRAAVPNSLFGTFNPFAEEVAGDWTVYAAGAPHKHLGDVYLDGMSFYEAHSVDELTDPPLRTEHLDGWTNAPEAIRNPEQTRYVWYAEVGDTETTIWANFQGADPNVALVEINVRRSVFYPTQHARDFITVRGFELAQAASPWAPPTADQPGLIGPNWAKGWVIEDNVIHDAKCSGISLGKEGSTGHNHFSDRGDRPGYQYQIESVFAALRYGWDREHVGSHIVRRNHIYDCGQTGIVGHLGCVFSTIEDNHIHHIATKREFFGQEIGGIKLHAAIDVVIRHNNIHACTLGTWLDWQTQGTRLTRNLYHDNTRDLFVEVSHGPYLVDHNIFASRSAWMIFAQGGAFVNNLVAGTVSIAPVNERSTPYHLPHSTQVAGYAATLGGDDRHIGNLFLGVGDGEVPASVGSRAVFYGTGGYDGFPATYADYMAEVLDPTPRDREEFTGQRWGRLRQPAYIHDNAYANGATVYDAERGAVVLDEPVVVAVEEVGGEVYLVADLPAAIDTAQVGLVGGADLERVRFANADFEEPDGSPVRIDVDLVGNVKVAGEAYAVGPLRDLTSGASRIRVW